MFSVYCPRHQSPVLLGSRSVTALVNTPDGIVVEWRCRCGAEGSLLTGRHARPHPSVADAA
jgi:hypothetical protein